MDKQTGYKTDTICVQLTTSGDVIAVAQMVNKQKARKRMNMDGMTYKEAQKLLAPTQIGHVKWGDFDGMMEMGTSFKARPRASIPLFTSDDEQKLTTFCTKVAEALELISKHESKGSQPLKQYEVMAFERVLKVLEDETNSIYKEVKEEKHSSASGAGGESRRTFGKPSRLMRELEDVETLMCKLDLAAKKYTLPLSKK